MEELLCFFLKRDFKYIVDEGYQEKERTDGVNYYNSIDEALKDTESIGEEVAIFIRNGKYYEKLRVKKSNLILVGESREGVVIHYDDRAGVPDGKGGIIGTTNSAAVTIEEDAVGFTAINLTIQNSFDTRNTKFKKDNQAVALKSLADMCIFYKVNFKGYQDTLYADKGRHYYYECYIEGDVDFIFGGANVIIDKCIIHSLERGIKPKGYITAARTNDGIEDKDKFAEYGFVIKNSELTSNIEHRGIEEKDLVYLGRPWRQYATVVFLNNNFGPHISKLRWTHMSGGGRMNTPEEAFFRECGNKGVGVYKEKTSPIYELREEEVEEYSAENIFSSIPMYTAYFSPQEKLKKIMG